MRRLVSRTISLRQRKLHLSSGTDFINASWSLSAASNHDTFVCHMAHVMSLTSFIIQSTSGHQHIYLTLVFYMDGDKLIVRYMGTDMDTQPTLSFDELCSAVDMPSRKVRYYIQMGVVDRPDGINRWAKYTTRHVEQLLSIKKWQGAGLSLERIRELLHSEPADLPAKPQPPGSVEVWSRLTVAPGVELNVQAGASGLSPEALRSFFRKVMMAYQETKNTNQGENDE